ncbi:hypothetical protein CCACVL1_27337 [Corchorus capsularis]|uniref:Uncharacterized protein n=1 Tax=Corchorus capsularis TaxID=210143 RepID=A0A1R3GAW9_COCAP|nr:hypothetical protein CCACVL1_27337 [Corchorus capsularis]
MDSVALIISFNKEAKSTIPGGFQFQARTTLSLLVAGGCN